MKNINPYVQKFSKSLAGLKKQTNKLRYIIVIVKLLELKIKRKSLKQPNIIIMRDDFSFKKKRGQKTIKWHIWSAERKVIQGIYCILHNISRLGQHPIIKCLCRINEYKLLHFRLGVVRWLLVLKKFLNKFFWFQSFLDSRIIGKVWIHLTCQEKNWQ